MPDKLSNNDEVLKIITDSIDSDLIELDLSHMELFSLPVEITMAQQIKYLNLSGNFLSYLPDFIGDLVNLEELIIRDNGIRELPKSLTKLKKLKGLYASYNLIKEFPKIINEIPSLIDIELNNNEIISIPSNLKLPNLKFLALEGNKIYHFPKNIIKENNILGLLLNSNPINNIPLEIYDYQSDCIEEIKNYFDAIEKDQSSHLYEVKLLIVGRGQVGKTCLSRKLMNPNYEITFKENTTEGIHINKWNLACDYNKMQKDVAINIWDFGGQEIYHTTHQFFLTKRSIYLFVWDARQEEDYVSFDYWLNIITLLSDNSPVIIVQNKVDDRVKEIQQSLYKETFPNIIGFHKTSCLSRLGIIPLIDEIKTTISNLKHIGDELPNSWLQIRKIIEDDKRYYIEYNEYIDICNKHGLDNTSATYLSEYFHDLGVILHFSDDEILQYIVILKTEWGTDAVYKILDNNSITETQGRFTFKDIKSIWIENKFKDKHLELLQLMKKFELCFQIKDTKHYIAPSLLPTEEPPLIYIENKEQKTYFWSDTDNVTFEYHYIFMPAGIFNRFMVKMHNYIEHNFYWRNGVFLNFEDTIAKVLNNPLSRKIIIKIRGRNPKYFLSIIRFHINEIHKTLNNPSVKEMIPCICNSCKIEPRLFEYNILLTAIKKGIKTIQCHKSFKAVDILKLLEGIPKASDNNIFSLKKEILKARENIEELKKQNDSIIKQNILLSELGNNINNNLINLISQSEKRIVYQIQNKINTDEINKLEMIRIIDTVQKSILEISDKFGEEDPMIEESKKLNNEITSYSDLKGKLKLSIPIIPTILKYEKELSWDLKKAFKKIKNNFYAGNLLK